MIGRVALAFVLAAVACAPPRVAREQRRIAGSFALAIDSPATPGPLIGDSHNATMRALYWLYDTLRRRTDRVFVVDEVPPLGETCDALIVATPSPAAPDAPRVTIHYVVRSAAGRETRGVLQFNDVDNTFAGLDELLAAITPAPTGASAAAR